MEGLVIEKLNVEAEVGGGKRIIVSDFSLNVKSGETAAVVGESGSGKTMTALAVLGLLPDNCRAYGSVKLNGRELISLNKRDYRKFRAKDAVYLPQSGADYLDPGKKIGAQLYEELAKKGDMKKEERRAKAFNILSEVGLNEQERIMNSYPFQLSGGMAQRVILALGACNEPKLVIADEPTRGCDEETAAYFLEKTAKIFPQAAIITITHNVTVAKRSRFITVMNRGATVERGEADSVLSRPKHPYTQSLIDALPSNDFTVREILREDSGHGCVYQARCPYFTDKCANNTPSMKEEDGREWRCFNV